MNITGMEIATAPNTRVRVLIITYKVSDGQERFSQVSFNPPFEVQQVAIGLEKMSMYLQQEAEEERNKLALQKKD